MFQLSGLALIIIGAVIRDKYGDYFSYADNSFANVPVFLIVVGVIVFCVGFLGCCGAIKENYCMVTTFAVLLGIIFILEIVAGAVGFAYKSKVIFDLKYFFHYEKTFCIKTPKFFYTHGLQSNHTIMWS